MSIIDDFKAQFPEFPHAQVDQWLPVFESTLCCFYGGPYRGCDKQIILYLLAHMLTVMTTPGHAGLRSMSSKSVGSVSVSFGAIASSGTRNDWLGLTKYGQMFLLLTLRNSQGAFFV